MKIDVLIVGAGPVGLTMAAELARYGLSVRLVEKAAQATDKSKALVIWSRTLELMERMGCTAPFLAAGRAVRGASITAGGELIGHLDLSGVATRYPYALMIPQSATERLLAEHLASLGVAAERHIEFLRFSATESGVCSTLRHADGREEDVESSWLVGCDGAHSTVRHELGMEFQGDTLPSDWILADVHLSDVPNAGEINVLWHTEGVLVLFPITGQRYRVVADVGPAADGTRRADPTLEEVQAVLDRRGPGGIQASAPIWLAAFRINERKVAEYRAGRVFLAGDAAHIHSPAGGQGMNTGMQDAFNLAWKLARPMCRLAATR
jgi:2-polyprenyl-6-methoxyphenol hydroxylase-like FAD-dependent oxidoreductase